MHVKVSLSRQFPKIPEAQLMGYRRKNSVQPMHESIDANRRAMKAP
jgi:hypothetical protein